MSDGVDLGRRHFLTVATTVTGVVGAALFATPFLISLKPSARAQAQGGPLEVDLARLEEGGMIKVEWRGRSVAIVRRPQQVLDRLAGLNERLRDPNSAESEQPGFAVNVHRSIRPELLVVIANCTHLGCVPAFRPDLAPADLGADWQGGFYCPCHGSRFDMSGRVYKGVPAPLNLVVPPYRFIGDSTIQIGVEGGSA